MRVSIQRRVYSHKFDHRKIMQVVNFDLNEHNFISGQRGYFLLETSFGKKLLLNNICSHRGGPLHLSRRSCTSLDILCPWHEQKHSERLLQQRALPLICISNRATAIIAEPPDVSVSAYQTTILANSLSS